MKTTTKPIIITKNVIMTDPKEHYRLGNIVAIALQNFVVLLDSSTYPIHALSFKNYVENKFELPIRYIFLSHHHSDHSFGLSGLTTQETRVITHENFTPNLRNFFYKYISKKDNMEEGLKEMIDQSPENERTLIKDIQVPKPSITFSKKFTIIDNKSEISFKCTGGHCSDSSYAYFQDEKLVYSGDEVFFYDYPYVSDNSSNPENVINCIEELLEKEIHILIPAHGKAIIGEENVKFELKRFLKFFKTLKEIIIEKIQLKLNFEDIEFAFRESEEKKLLNMSDIEGICFEGIKKETLKKFYNYYLKSN